MNTVIPNQFPSSFFPHNYLSGKVVRIFHIVECQFRTSYVESQGEIVNILLKIKNSFLPTKQILIGL